MTQRRRQSVFNSMKQDSKYDKKHKFKGMQVLEGLN